MKQLKQDEIAWKKIKLIGGGGEGLELEYSFLIVIEEKGYMKKGSWVNDLVPNDDLINAIKSLRIPVAKIENIDYARRILSLPDYEPTNKQIELTEKTVQESMKQIEVVALHFSERRKEQGVIISYKKEDLNGKITGHPTTWIQLSGEIYGIEDELRTAIDKIKEEAFKYEFEGKIAESSQLTIFSKRKGKKNVEDAVVVEDKIEQPVE